MDFINNIFGKKEHWGFSSVASHIGLDSQSLFLKNFKKVGDFEDEIRESILFITAGVDDGSGEGNMKIKDSSYNAADRMTPIGRWNEYCRDTKKQMRENGEAYETNAMQDYIKRRYDTCPYAFSEITKKFEADIATKDEDIKVLEERNATLVTEKNSLQSRLDELNAQNEEDTKAVAGLTKKTDNVGEDVFLPNKMIDNFAPFKNVEHLTMREKANQWVEQQNIIRRDYISRLDNIQSEVDLEIEDTLNNVNKLSNYKTLVLITLYIIKTVILVILLFIGWFAIKMIRERDS